MLKEYGRFAGLRVPARVLDTPEERMVAIEQEWPEADDSRREEAVLAFAKASGKVPFDQMIPLATRLLNASSTIRSAVACRAPLIVVDEFQDLNFQQWGFIRAVGEESQVLALGDPDQMIYERAHAAVEARMADFEKWKGAARQRLSGPNFRCPRRDIIEFAEALLNGQRYPITEGMAVQVFPAYANECRARLASIWSALRDESDDATIAFLTPSRNSAQRMAGALRTVDKEAAVPIRVRARVETHAGNLDAFRLALCALFDYAQLPSNETARQAARALVVLGSLWTRRKITEAALKKCERRISRGSRADSPLRDFLLGGEHPQSLEEFAALLVDALAEDKELATLGESIRLHGIPDLSTVARGQGLLFEQYREERVSLSLDGAVVRPARTSMLSMYQAKGREFDYVVLVVDDRFHSTKTSLDELRRLYYVAATRAKKWLGVVYTPNRSGPVLEPVLE